MSLKEYQKKRDFRSTPEPSAESEGAGGGNRYVIQKHDASSLHYDFRIELDGALKSWAVPKGPSLDPSEKRLAVRVEDHPVDYADFEGAIPEDEYGGGPVMVWDTGTWKPKGDPREGLEKGELKFTLHGEKLKGGWALVHMRNRGKKNWLLIKEKDRSAKPGGDILEEAPDSVLSGWSIDEIRENSDAVWSSQAGKLAVSDEGEDAPIQRPKDVDGAQRAKQPKYIEPQKATLYDEAPQGDDWLHEVKYDGYRILAVAEDGGVTLYTRRGNDWTHRFRGLQDALEDLDLGTCMLDGEVVAIAPDGDMDFQTLQNAIKGQGGAHMLYYVFDCPFAGGYDLRKAKLTERKRLLQGMLSEQDAVVRYSDHVRGRGPTAHENACGLNLEGIISKRADSPYESKRTRTWRKVKCVKSQEFVIAGWSDPEGSRHGFGSLLLGVYEGGGLVYAGRVGTGFDDETLDEIHGKLKDLERKTCPFRDPERITKKGVHWASPKLVGEVAFTTWTRDGRLRHPAFQGLREDKAPKDVVREEPKPEAEGSGDKGGADPQDRRTGGSKEKTDHRVAGVSLSHPNKVLFPNAEITKRDVAEYYEAMADYVLPHIANRPLTLLRCPEGRDESCFYQKHVTEAMPDQVGGVMIEEDQGERAYVTVDGLEGLVALVQMGALEIHPWACRNDRIDRPDRLIFDFDPDKEAAWEDVVAGARLCRDIMEDAGLRGFLKTSGGKGLHIVAPIERRSGWDDTKRFAKAVAKRLANEEPKRFIATASKEKRKGKVYVDYLRNARGATMVGAYTVRARNSAPVSTPVRWDELSASLSPQKYALKNLTRRLSRLKNDPWDGFFDLHQSITKGALEAVQA